MPLSKNRKLGSVSRKHKTFKLDGVKDQMGNLVGIRKVGTSLVSRRMNRSEKSERAVIGYDKIMNFVERGLGVTHA